jgi:hypothetical protein
MLVHAVIAFAPLAALSFILDNPTTEFAGIQPGAWRLLLWLSLAGMLVVAIPATLTGISERNHMYANWPASHRAKLLLSVALIVLVTAELVAVSNGAGGGGAFSLLGLAIVFANNAIALALSHYGLRLTLGRQGFGSTSYTPDMDRVPPVDILEVVAKQARQPAKMIDIRKEGGG